MPIQTTSVIDIPKKIHPLYRKSFQSDKYTTRVNVKIVS